MTIRGPPRRPPRLSGPPLPPGPALRAGRRLRLPCSSAAAAAAAAALFISSHRLPLSPRRRVRGGEPWSRRRRFGAAAAAERELAKGGVRTKPAGDPGSRATSPPSSSSPTPPSSPVSLASPPSPGSLALTAMAAADRGSARHWLEPCHVTGAGCSGGEMEGAGEGPERRPRLFAGGAAEPSAAGFSGGEREGDGDREGEKEVRAARLRGGRAVSRRAGRPAPRPLGCTNLCRARPRAPGTPVAVAVEGSGPLACALARPGRLGGRGPPWARQQIQVLRSVSLRCHSVVRVLQMRKLKHKELKTLTRGRSAGKRRGWDSNPCAQAHSEAKLLH